MVEVASLIFLESQILRDGRDLRVYEVQFYSLVDEETETLASHFTLL